MAEAWGAALLAVYGLAGRLLIPVLPAILGARARKGREDPVRLQERYGHAGVPRPDRPVVWVHAASVGETNAVAPLVRNLVASGRFVLLTTVTVTGAATAARLLPEGAVHQFAPVDVRPLVQRFLGHWRPGLAVFVESEIWPVITDELALRRTPHVIVNARLSEHSFQRWRGIGRAPRRVFGRVSLALAQTATDAERLRALGIPEVRVLGNLKFDAPPPAATADAIATLRAALGGRPAWLAASTHPGEEDIIAAAHRRLLAARPDLVTIIVPRHPDRGPAIGAMLRGQGLPALLRSQGTALPSGSGILVADTLGELGLFYRAAPVAFIGGSLVPHGGQNPIEPARLRAAILHGPNVANFADIYRALDESGGALQIGGADDLAGAIAMLMDDEPGRRAQLAAAEAALAPFTGALARTMAALRPYLAAMDIPAW